MPGHDPEHGALADDGLGKVARCRRCVPLVRDRIRQGDHGARGIGVRELVDVLGAHEVTGQVDHDVARRDDARTGARDHLLAGRGHRAQRLVIDAVAITAVVRLREAQVGFAIARARQEHRGGAGRARRHRQGGRGAGRNRRGRARAIAVEGNHAEHVARVRHEARDHRRGGVCGFAPDRRELVGGRRKSDVDAVRGLALARRPGELDAHVRARHRDEVRHGRRRRRDRARLAVRVVVLVAQRAFAVDRDLARRQGKAAANGEGNGGNETEEREGNTH